MRLKAIELGGKVIEINKEFTDLVDAGKTDVAIAEFKKNETIKLPRALAAIIADFNEKEYEAFLELIPQLKPTVICTDLHIPVMDGFELTKRIMPVSARKVQPKTEKTSFQIAVIGASTVVQDEESSVVFGMPKAAIERGAARYILSPNDIAGMLTQLQNGNPAV
ncbi:MAG TPA: chemotaxis protein CheB [Candidatus Brocadiaceae bacterium]|nr:chemotaxis protein CheB [Candidatus Brocadiaceae bacterium]